MGNAIIKPKFIRVIGNFGAGKSFYTAQELKKEEYKDYIYLKEPVEENPILPLRYKEPKKYAYVMQMFMANWFKQQIENIPLCAKGVITDNGVIEAFSEVLLFDKLISMNEFKLIMAYCGLTDAVLYKRFDVEYHYLDTTPEQCLKNIIDRGRECEKDVSLDYLSALGETMSEYRIMLDKSKVKLISPSFPK